MTKSVPFYLIVTLFAVLSCGKRITSHERILIKTDSLKYSKFQEIQSNFTFNDISELKPIDISKPMVINGIYYYNAAIKFDKSIISSENKKEGLNLSYTSSEKETNIKKTEKTDNSNLYIGLFFVFLLFVFAYFKKWF